MRVSHRPPSEGPRRGDGGPQLLEIPPVPRGTDADEGIEPVCTRPQLRTTVVKSDRL